MGQGPDRLPAGLWRYRASEDRVICQIDGAGLVVLVLQISQRSEARRYRRDLSVPPGVRANRQQQGWDP